MTESSKPTTTAAPKKKGGGGIFVVFMLVLAGIAGAIGFWVGFTQPFVPVDGGRTGWLRPGLKHQYCLRSSGSEQSPYSISVSINSHKLPPITASGRIIDVTDLVLRGRNKITFEAKRLPQGMFDAHA